MSYDSSFGSAGFFVRGPSSGDSNAVNVSERHIPGSDSNYIDIGGNANRHLMLTLFFTAEADYLALLALRGTLGSLVWNEGTYSAILLGVARSERALGSNHETTAGVEFILV